VDVTIERAKAEDFAQIFRFLPQLWPDRRIDYHDARVAFEHILLSREQGVLVARNKRGVAVGFASFTAAHRIEYGGRCLIVNEIVVEAEKRRLGVGRQLMEAVEFEAIRRDCAVVRVTSAAWRKDAHAFYAKRGYEAQEAVRLAKRL
jgi:GNAT superfamily N-acetyltransferase